MNRVDGLRRIYHGKALVHGDLVLIKGFCKLDAWQGNRKPLEYTGELIVSTALFLGLVDHDEVLLFLNENGIVHVTMKSIDVAYMAVWCVQSMQDDWR